MWLENSNANVMVNKPKTPKENNTLANNIDEIGKNADLSAKIVAENNTEEAGENDADALLAWLLGISDEDGTVTTLPDWSYDVAEGVVKARLINKQVPGRKKETKPANWQEVLNKKFFW